MQDKERGVSKATLLSHLDIDTVIFIMMSFYLGENKSKLDIAGNNSEDFLPLMSMAVISKVVTSLPRKHSDFTEHLYILT